MDEQRVAYRLNMISRNLERYGLDGLAFLGREIENPGDLRYQLMGAGLSAPHAILVLPGRRKPVVVANVHDAGNVPKELYRVSEYGYTDDPSGAIAQEIQKSGVTKLGIATSRDTAALDVTNYGMLLNVRRALRGSDVRISSSAAENVLYSAYAIRTPEEIEGLRKAVRMTDDIFDAAECEVLRAGVSEREISTFFHEQMDRLGVQSSWARNSCPIVAVRNNSVRGHHEPGDDVITPGYVLFTDFGVKDPDTNMPGDLQRTYFLADPNNDRETERVRDMFILQARARDAAIDKMVPGMRGLDVDAAGRDIITGAGYEEFNHALGHTLSAEGVHGIGPIAASPMPKYGDKPHRRLEAGMVLTSEPSVIDPEGRQGRIATEFDVLVTRGAPEVLNKRQDDLFLL
ncbi:M24 family metallopeptidase [Candidatus Aenigmatarchaeota archaeon]